MYPEKLQVSEKEQQDKREKEKQKQDQQHQDKPYLELLFRLRVTETLGESKKNPKKNR